IFMADLDVWTPTDIVSSGLQIPDNLALDPANGSIYWTDPGTQTISRADRDGSNPTVLPLGTLQRPKGLAIGASPATTTNSVPTADAGGPYTISEGSSLNLDASGSTDPDTDPLTYRWDLDNDGTFGEAGEPVSETATLSWATLQSLGITGDGVYSMSLQVSDGRGGTTTDVFTLTVIDQTPTDLTFDGGTIDENSVNGTVVGTVHGVDPERDARISALLAANPDLSYSAVTGKFYEYVATSRRWTAARTDATTRALNGVNGQLVTVRSGTEQTIVHGVAAGTGATIWMGGSDQGTEGQWFWYEGLTADDQFWTGSGTGTAFNGAYQNWGSPREPNNRGNEDYLLMYASGPRNGTWDDGMITSFHAYIVEWNADEVLDQTDPLVYSLVDDAGARFSIDSDTGVVRVSDDSRLDFELAASHNIVVRVTDSAGNDFQKTLTVSLNDLNDNESPVISSIADVTTPEDTSVGQIRFTVSDAESAAPGLTVTATSDNQSLIADADIVVHGKGSKRRLSFTPVKDSSGGPATITVTVSDGTATTSTSFNVTITPQNDAPVFKGPNSQILKVVGGGRIVQAPGLLSGASDADNDPLKIVMLSGPSHGTLLTKPDGSFSYKVDDDYTGNDQFTYVVSDGTANSPVRKVILQIPSLATLNTVRTNQTVTSADAPVDSTDSSVKSDVASTKATVTAAATRPAEHRDANDDDLDYVPPPTLTTEDEDHKGVQALSAPVADSDQFSFQFQQSVSIALAPADRLSPNDGRDAGDADRSSEGSGHRLTTEVIDTEFLTGLSYEQYAELRETVHQLDQFKEHLDSEYQISDVTASSVVVAGTSLVIGSVVTAIRSGVLALGLLSQLPVWTLFDPLMVMDGVEGDEGDSLQDIVDRQNEKTDEQQT
ncbi:MAG: Ig-like domain-containing protein, partial [Fuerstiella sp.]